MISGSNYREIHCEFPQYQGQFQEKFNLAYQYYQQTIKINPNSAQAWCNLGNIFQQQGQFELAIEYCQKSLELNPDYIEAYHSLGCIFLKLGKLGDSQKYYEQALQLDKNYASSHFGLANVLLKQGDFIAGFSEYEWRWQHGDSIKRNFSQSLWDGANFSGKTLLVYTEQGLGDSIQFIRYIPLVKKLGGRVIVECNKPELQFIFTTVSGIDELLIRGEQLPDFDLQIPLMSLPRIFGTTLETIPAEIPYLYVPKSIYFPIPVAPEKSLKVGICWQTNSTSKNIQIRSCPIAYVQEIINIETVNFYILQKEVSVADLEWLKSQTQIHNLSSSFNDLSDTAATIKQLDLVITIDTVIAHLAGALGKPVWVMLNFDSDWRWLTDREDSLWYPTMRLFRQAKIDDWNSVFIQVKQALIEFLVFQHNLPDLPANFDQAYQYYQQNNLAEAEKICRRILAEERQDFQVLHLLAALEYLAGRNEEAIQLLNQVITLPINSSQGYLSVGKIFRVQGYFEAAIEYYQKSLELNSGYIEVYNELGSIFFTLGKLEESQKYYEGAIKLDKSYVNAHLGLAEIFLKQGNFIPGFSKYEWRSRTQGFIGRNFSQPVWDGSNFSGKTLLVYTEEGLGDSIQFIRYIPLVKKLGGRVIVECNQGQLKFIFTTVSGIDELFIRGEKLPDFDLQIPLMSLPRIFGTTLETIPVEIPYLYVPKSIYIPIPLAPEKNLKVGICWQTNSTSGTSKIRSCLVAYVQEIINIDTVNFYILQKEVLVADLEWLNSQTQIHNLSSYFNDLSDTAAAIKQLDLVITIDTVIAHLAGALGKPVWVMLNFDSDWRWLTDREDSPWYPTIKLFRQPKIGDWDSVFKQVKQSLENLLDNNSPSNKISEKKGIKLSEEPLKKALAQYIATLFKL